MKKILHKRQIQSIILLTAVIFILLCGVVYTVSTRTSADSPVNAPVDAETKPHELLRAARTSANARIEWETNLGGTGEEVPVTVLQKNNEIYVFGNTSSSDLDFAGADAGKTRGFCTRLSLAGRTLAFTVFDFTIVKTIPTAAGFAVAGNEGSAAGLYLLSDELTVTAKTEMSPTHTLAAVGLYVFDNRYFLVAECEDETTQKTSILLNVYTPSLVCEREKVFIRAYALSFLDILPCSDGYLLAAYAHYQTAGYLTLARFTTIGEPSYSDLELGYPYEPTAFMPLGNGYAASCDNGGKCELLRVDSRLRQESVQFLTNAPNENRKTLFYADGSYIYTGEKLIELSDDGRSIGSLEFSVRAVTDFCSNGVASFVAGVSDDGVKIALIGKSASEVLPLQASAQKATLYAGASHILLCCDTAGKTADCGDFFGGTDVWLSRLPLSAA